MNSDAVVQPLGLSNEYAFSRNLSVDLNSNQGDSFTAGIPCPLSLRRDVDLFICISRWP